MNNIKPPYYAVIFTAKRSNNLTHYASTAAKMEQLAAQQPGYLGFVASSCADGRTVATSYWQSNADILNWQQQAAHVAAQTEGKRRWYDEYNVEVAKVERTYSWRRNA